MTARTLIRELGLGRAWLAVRQALGLGLGRTLRTQMAKRQHLKDISEAPVIDLSGSKTEVHMLLHHDRLYEGIWAFYSLAYHSGSIWRLVVHDDGSLDGDDCNELRRMFPSVSIITRQEADLEVDGTLERLGLEKCRLLRRTLPFARKLFDVILLTGEERVVLLDSDVLFFKRPTQLLAAFSSGNASYLYMEDIENRYCLAIPTITAMVGENCIPRFNPGIAVVPTRATDLQMLERYLERPEFWHDLEQPSYYAELTLWAMLMTAMGATPLPSSYSIDPSPRDRPLAVCGHYCGGPRARYHFYTDGIPAVKQAVVHAKTVVQQT
jgi:hypothetical protein